MPTNITIRFAEENNKVQYLNAVSIWLNNDYHSQKQPRRHFFHNLNMIEEAFAEQRAMVSVNEKDEVIGFMIWHISANSSRAEIDIVEIKNPYRRQGIFNKMLANLTERYRDICTLSAMPLPEAEIVFQNAGWEGLQDINRTKHYIKIVKPVLSPVNSLPCSGHVIVICATDYYTVIKNLDSYQHAMQYFPIEFDADRKLTTPIVVKCSRDDYAAVYYNGELIVQQRLKHLFNREACDCTTFGCLTLTKIEPADPIPFERKRFFDIVLQEDAKIDTATSAEESSSTKNVESQHTDKKLRLE